jgi:hypothetical protein
MYSYQSNGNISAANRLQNEISNLEEELKECYVCYNYAQEKEEINQAYSFFREQKQNETAYHNNRLIQIRQEYSAYNDFCESGHINSSNTWKQIEAPTCTETGVSLYECEYCDFYLSKTVSELGHNLLDPDCVNESKCSRCNYSVGTPLGHDWKDATCITDKVCLRCSAVGDVLALGHDYIHHQGKSATCTEYGWNQYDTCSRCTYSTYSEISSLGHNMLVSSKKDATVTEDGFSDTYCSRCSFTNYEIYYATGTLGLSYNFGIDPYTKQEGYIVNIGSAIDKDVYIPPIYNGYPVVTVNINGCQTVENISIPASVNTINANNCTALKSVQFASESNLTYLSFNGCSNLKEFVMPKSNLTIITFSFQNCINLKRLEISESVDTIPSYSYPLRGCNSIETLVMPDLSYDESINYALKDLYGVSMGEVPQALKHVVFSKIVGIDSMDFYNCSYIESISLPKTFQRISGGFYGCTSLKTIYYDGTTDEWNALVDKGNINTHLTAYSVVCSNGTISV